MFSFPSKMLDEQLDTHQVLDLEGRADLRAVTLHRTLVSVLRAGDKALRAVTEGEQQVVGAALQR